MTDASLAHGSIAESPPTPAPVAQQHLALQPPPLNLRQNLPPELWSGGVTMPPAHATSALREHTRVVLPVVAVQPPSIRRFASEPSDDCGDEPNAPPQHNHRRGRCAEGGGKEVDVAALRERMKNPDFLAGFMECHQLLVS